VFWAVGTAATLGASSTLVGSVLAVDAITAGAGAVVQGRLLARDGAITLAANTVSRPACTGSLSLAQTPTAGTALVEGTAVGLPVTTVTDSRTGIARDWTVTATVSDLVTAEGAVIPAADISLDQTGTFTTGTGTLGTLGLVSATGTSLGSVYTYTPTATLAPQGNITAGSYAGTVTQTVV
jgi:type VI secretion system secreted protein VgrG